jgi:hypothetical protein
MNAWLNYVGCGFIALSVLACGSKGEDGDDEETGGTGGSSGSSTGGSSSGGTSTGGTSTGGTSTGGTSTGGTSGSGGSSTAELRYGFDSDEEGWIVQYTSSGTLLDSTAAPIIDKSTVVFEYSAEEGDPDPGALEATIPYETESQYVGFGVNIDEGVDLSTTTLSARVRIKEGLGDVADLMTNPGGAKLYVKTGMYYCYAAGPVINMGDMPHPIGEWHTIQFNLTRQPNYVDPNCTDPFDPADVRELGIQFDTGSTTMTPQEAVVNIDTIRY